MIAPATARPPASRLLLAGAVAIAAALATAGAQLAAAAWQERPSPSASAEGDGVALQIRRAVWLDHAVLQRDPTAHALLPGLPDHLHRRLSVSFVVENRTQAERRFTWQDLVLRWPRRDAFASSRDGRAAVAIPPGAAVLLDASFDVPEGDDPLTLWWERGAIRSRLLVTRTPLHAVPTRPGGPTQWPRLASELPRGRADAGEKVFRRSGCTSCHGDPAVPRSNGAAPDLAGVGVAAERRAPDKTAAQYLYESILDPDTFVARACDGPGPCEQPRMPSYGEVLTTQDAADLVAYLLAQRRQP
jgi:mono/diheme cytochrome c family protein